MPAPLAADSAIDWSAPSYEEVLRRHRWPVPERLNVGVLCCDRHADGSGRLALVETDEAALVEPFAPARYSFEDVKVRSDRLMAALAARGVEPGDRVAVMLPQRAETAIAHIAIIKMGAVSVPLSPLFREDALVHRLGASGAKALFVDAERRAHVEPIRDRLPALRTVVQVGPEEPAPGAEGWDELLAGDHPPVAPADTAADDPCMLIFTSGTSGLPKGVLHAHRFVPGRLSAMELIHRIETAPPHEHPFWTPSDWAWVAGLVDCVLTPWVFGRPVLAFARRGFDPEKALELVARTGARGLFLAPTAVNVLRHVDDAAARWPGLREVTIHTAGEALGASTFAWAARTFGRVFELYGMTEIGALVGSSPFVEPVPGAIGKPYPGHDVVLLDDAGEQIAGAGEGEIAVRRPDPGMFLGYWDDPEGTAARFAGDLFRTGDWAERDAAGYLWYRGRRDDMFNTRGYRVGPTEIEGSLEKHPAVQHAAVVGAVDEADPDRPTVVKAFVQLAPGHAPSAELAERIREHVRDSLAAYQYPRRIVFCATLPMTVTGKIQRAELRADDADARFGVGEVF